MKKAHTPKILYSKQNVENWYLVEPECSTAVKGARQNTLDINITGLKMRYKSIFRYIYGISFSQFYVESSWIYGYTQGNMISLDNTRTTTVTESIFTNTCPLRLFVHI
jgi:hypothetical protein